MLVILSLLTILLFGYLVSIVLVQEMHPIGRIGVSYLLGSGLYTFVMFCYSNLGIRITSGSILISLLLLILLIFLLIKVLKRKINLGFRWVFKSLKQLDLTERIMIIIIGFFVILSFSLTIYYPITIWDALALYDFRAKIIAQTGFFTQIASNYFYFFQYPLFTSFSHVIVYIFGGKNPQFIYTLMYLAFLLAFYGLLKEFVSRKISLLTTTLLATSPIFFEHSTFAYTNLPYSIFITLGTICLFIWIVKRKHVGWLILSGLLTGLSTWSRSTEPFWVVNLLIVFVYSAIMYRKKILFPIWYCVSFFPIKWIWVQTFYKLMGRNLTTMNMATSELTGIRNTIIGNSLDIKRMTEILKFVYEKIIQTWYPLILVFVLFLILNLIKIRLIDKKVTIFLIFIVINFGLLIYGTYAYSLGVSYWESIPDSARRMAMFFIPLMLFYIGLMIDGLVIDLKN